MFAVSLSIDMYETKIINRKKSFKVRENSQRGRDKLLGNTTQLNGVYIFFLFAFTHYSSRSSRLEKLLIVVGVTEASARLTT